MKKSWLIGVMSAAAAVALGCGSAVSAAPAQERLQRVGETDLSSYVRGFNPMDVDEQGNRLFMATAHNAVVLVFNLKTGALIATLHDVADPHMIAYVKSRNEIWVSDSKGACVTILDGKDYHVVRKIALGTNPTVGFYDTRNEVFYIQEEGKNSKLPTSLINVIPVNATGPTAQIRFDDDNLEGMVVDHRRNRLYVNLRQHAQIAVVDLKTNNIVETWTVPGMGANTPMAIDEEGDRLLVAARDPAKLYVIDPKDGHFVSSNDIMPTADTIIFDPVGKRVFLTGFEGITIFRQRSPDKLEQVADVKDPGVKHSFFVPHLGRLYAAAAKTPDTTAAMHIYAVSKR